MSTTTSSSYPLCLAWSFLTVPLGTRFLLALSLLFSVLSSPATLCREASIKFIRPLVAATLQDGSRRLATLCFSTLSSLSVSLRVSPSFSFEPSTLQPPFVESRCPSCSAPGTVRPLLPFLLAALRVSLSSGWVLAGVIRFNERKGKAVGRFVGRKRWWVAQEGSSRASYGYWRGPLPPDVQTLFLFCFSPCYRSHTILSSSTRSSVRFSVSRCVLVWCGCPWNVGKKFSLRGLCCLRNGDPKGAGYLSARILGSDFNVLQSSNCATSHSRLILYF